MLETSVDGGQLRIALADQTTDLKRPLLVDRFAGTGGIEGPAEWEGKIKERSWGRCFNVAGEVIDTANNIVCFGDPKRQWQSFDSVRDKGVPGSPLTLLAWQGSADATFTALQATVAPEGGGVLCPSIACVKWWTQPAGDLHADIRGETDGGYVETAPEIAAKIVAARSTLAVDPAELAAAVAARPAACGWRIDDDSTTAASALSDMLAGVSLSWLIVNNAIGFRRWEWSASTRAARSEGVTRKQVYKPVATRTLGYQRNWSPMARGDLAAAVLAGDVIYDDGSTAQDRQPAEAGATNGATGDAPVGGTKNPDGSITGARAASQLVSDVDTNAVTIVAAQTQMGTWKTEIDQQTQTPDGTIREVVDQLGVKTEQHDIFITQLQQVDPSTGTAKMVASVNADGVISAFEQFAGPGGSFIGWFADVLVMVDRNGGGAPIQILSYDQADGWVFGADITAKKITYESLVPKFSGQYQSLDPSGWYQELPGGLIMQGGQYRQTINSEVQLSIVFPRAFPNQLLSVGAIPHLTAFSNARDLWLQTVGDPTTQGFSIQTQAATGNDQTLDGFDWWAWGK